MYSTLHNPGAPEDCKLVGRWGQTWLSSEDKMYL